MSLKFRCRAALFVLTFLAAFAPMAPIVVGASVRESPRAPGKAQTTKAPYSGVITGQVVTLDGRAVPGATVILLGPASGPPPNDFVGASRITVRTNASGQFRANHLPPGKWDVTCEAKGYFQHFEYRTYPKPSFAAMWEPIYPETVVGMDSSDSTASLTLLMRPTAVLWGRILDSEGRLVTNQTVWLIARQNPEGGLGISYKTVSVDAQGYYRMEFRANEILSYPELYPSSYPYPWVRSDDDADKARPEREEREQLGLFVPGRPGHGPSRTFILQNGKRTYQDFQLVRGASVSGTVYASDGKTPVAGARVSTDREEIPFEIREPGKPFSTSDSLITWESFVETDAQGHYTKKVDPDVKTPLSVLGYNAAKDRILWKNSKEETIRLRDGEQRTGVDFILKEVSR